MKSICEQLLLLIVIFSQENNHIQRCLDVPKPKLHKKLTCVMLVHSPQTAFHKKIIYNFVWIYLGRSIRPEVVCKKSVLRILQNSHENTCVRVKLVSTMLEKHCVRIFFSQCCPNTSEKTLHKKCSRKAHRYTFAGKPAVPNMSDSLFLSG